MKILALSLFLFFSISVNAQTAVVISDNANLRGTPFLSGKVVDTVSKNSMVEIIKKVGAWYLVQTADYVGWLHGNTIRLNPSYESPDAATVYSPAPTPMPVPLYSPPAARQEPVQPTPSSSRTYIRGPRGGCYYYNSSGRKTYVDRSLCN